MVRSKSVPPPDDRSRTHAVFQACFQRHCSVLLIVTSLRIIDDRAPKIIEADGTLCLFDGWLYSMAKDNSEVEGKSPHDKAGV
jgi:hypothetical protein